MLHHQHSANTHFTHTTVHVASSALSQHTFYTHHCSCCIISTEPTHALHTALFVLYSFCLSAGCRFQAAVKESKHVHCEQIECDVTERGSVTISSILLSLKTNSSMVVNSGEFMYCGCIIQCLFICFWGDSAQWARVSSFTWFLDHPQWCTTVSRTALNDWSTCHRDLYLTTHNIDKRQTSMPLAGFKHTISAGEQLQTYVLDHMAAGTGNSVSLGG
jgi:hypothetical protein